jgi:hypothetical protein
LKQVVARRTHRIGVQSLYYDTITGEYEIEIRNRTYHSVQKITPEKVDIWKRAIEGKFDGSKHDGSVG